MSFGARFFFAWACFFRVLVDGAFAARAAAVRDGTPAKVLPPPPAPEKTDKPVAAGFADGALALLALLQRDGRLVDFLQQDVATFSDAEVGTAARVVHEGCQSALRQHVTIVASCKEDPAAKMNAVREALLEDAPTFDGQLAACSGKAATNACHGNVAHFTRDGYS